MTARLRVALVPGILTLLVSACANGGNVPPNVAVRRCGGAGIGRISMDGKLAQYSKNLDPQASPSGIAAGPDGKMWFVETNPAKMGRVTL